MVIVPAYGRDYKSKKEVMADWDANKDFLVQDMFKSGYINKEQALKELKGQNLQVRYKKLTQVFMLKVA